MLNTQRGGQRSRSDSGRAQEGAGRNQGAELPRAALREGPGWPWPRVRDDRI